MMDLKLHLWLSFHSFYDFGYLLKILTGNLLPLCPQEFHDSLGIFFGTFYDLKYPLAGTHYSKKGLQEIADLLDIQRIGTAHQAGSDSLLTLKVFFKLKEMGLLDIEKDSYVNKLYGIYEQVKQADAAEESIQ